MGRRRLGVVLLVPPPIAGEIDGLRRALGDGALGRIAPHLTLVPPVNVRDDRVGDALGVIRRAAAGTAPLTLTLGPPATFLPAAPVVHLPAAGEERAAPGLSRLERLRDAVFVEPLARPLTHPFAPHVTLADEADESRIAAALVALAGYVVDVTFTAVHLLEEGPGRAWRPIAEAPLGAPAVVARGPMQVELVVTAMLDPEAGALVEREWPAELEAQADEEEPERASGEGLVITARRGGEVVGVAEGRVDGPEGRLWRVVVAGGERGTGVGSHLLEAFRSAAAERGCRWVVAEVADATSAAHFLRSRGWGEDAGSEGGGRVRLVSGLAGSPRGRRGGKADP